MKNTIFRTQSQFPTAHVRRLLVLFSLRYNRNTIKLDCLTRLRSHSPSILTHTRLHHNLLSRLSQLASIPEAPYLLNSLNKTSKHIDSPNMQAKILLVLTLAAIVHSLAIPDEITTVDAPDGFGGIAKRDNVLVDTTVDGPDGFGGIEKKRDNVLVDTKLDVVPLMKKEAFGFSAEGVEEDDDQLVKKEAYGFSAEGVEDDDDA